MSNSQICQPCGERIDAWLFSKPSEVLPTFGIAYGSGAAYDASPAGIRDRMRGRHEQWRLLVNDHMASIAAACRAAGHSDFNSPNQERTNDRG